MPTSTHDRVELAIEQLSTAIELFLGEKSDASALTLAGAAEEVLGQAVKLSGRENALTEAWGMTAPVHRLIHNTELSWQAFRDGENHARNALKHLRLPAERTLEADLRRAAQWMIVRACANHQRLDFEPTDAMRAFDTWFYQNEVGV